jgi:hypothetical protein
LGQSRINLKERALGRPKPEMSNASKPLHDWEIRAALRAKLKEIHANEPDTAIIDELSLCQGDARIDVAVVNGSFSGYEIKSDQDKLVRLPHQLSVYERCFDTITVVVGSKHVAGCYGVIPSCWGIWEAISGEDGVEFVLRREPTVNHEVSPGSVVQLLWRQEALEVSREVGLTASAKAGRRELWEALVTELPRERLLEIVRTRLRARGDWRSGPTPFRGDGLSRSAATSQRSQENRRWLLSQRFQRPPN